MKIGNKVKHKDQDIWGIIVDEGWSGKTVIISETNKDFSVWVDSESFEPCDEGTRLEFRKSELEVA